MIFSSCEDNWPVPEKTRHNTGQRPEIVVICGPTAIGKTSIAISVAECFGGEIVGADSMQIYRHLDIGTAKPTPEERGRVPHHLIDVADPDEPYDAARFYRDARQAIADILGRGRLPVVAGGTGFYIRALLYGLCDAAPEDPSVRSRLREEAFEQGGGHLYGRLQHCDPEAASKIHPNDTYRVLRALEVFEITGITMTDYRRRHCFSDAPFEPLKLGLDMDRVALYERIDRRVDQMIADGLLDEVKRLLDKGYAEHLRPMQALGYRHMIDYIRGRLEWGDMIDTLKRDTRRYAKRQFTWFRADSQIIWSAPTYKKKILNHVRCFIRREGCPQ